MMIFTKAFDLGVIPYQRVLETTVLPFLKLAKKVEGHRNNPQSGTFVDQAARDNNFSAWVLAFITPLTWHSSIFEGQQGRFVPSLRPSKRAEMVKALTDANVPEVNLDCCVAHVC